MNVSPFRHPRVPVGEVERRRLAGVGRLTWDMAARGWVHLVQLRHAEGDFTYLAVARPRSQRRPGLPLAIPMKEAA